MTPARIGLLGARGRMGSRVSHLLSTDWVTQAQLSAQANRGDALDSLLSTDVVIDFSSPTRMVELAQLALASDRALPAFVVGSTGWKPEEYRSLELLSARAPVLVSFNFSTGVLVLSEILKSAAPILKKLGYSSAIVETHHCHKKDAPSGTALLLQRSMSEGSDPSSIPIHSVRAGEIVGDHSVTYYGAADTLTLSHHAMDRTIFARGAIDVALWLAGKRRDNPSLTGLIGIEAFFEDLKCSNSHRD